MTFIITGGCCSDSSCIPVCPVQCIRPRPGDPDFTSSAQLYIDPRTCIDCAACVDQCPVDAIYAEWEIPDELRDYEAINAEFFEGAPLTPSAPEPTRHRSLPTHSPALSVAVVGSGAAGAYAATELAHIAGVNVTLFDSLPTPGGLIRFGVAPDHPRTKQIGDRLGRVLRRNNVSCYFNVEVGVDVSIDDLLTHHHAVVWAGGAPSSRSLEVPGETLPGSISARDFVAWYNGHPDHAEPVFDLSCERAVVIGNGNVAVDVARLLLLPPDELVPTDMADHAINALGASRVRDVVMTARRGPESAACSLAELTGLAQADSVSLVTSAGEVEHLAGMPSDRRARALLEASTRPVNAGDRTVTMRFGLTPTSINGIDRVESVTFTRPDGSQETIPTTLVIRAIGYAGMPIPGLPFDDTTRTLPHIGGGVVSPASGEPIRGVYCAGWIKRGSTGAIGTNRSDASETVATLLEDFSAGRLKDPAGSLADLNRLIRERCPDVVDKHGWARIDQTERARGHDQGRPRVKLVHRKALVAVARS